MLTIEPDHIRRFREEANRLRLRSLLLGHKEDVSEFAALARDLDAAADRIEGGARRRFDHGEP